MPNHIPDDTWTRKQVNTTDTAPSPYGSGALDSYPAEGTVPLATIDGDPHLVYAHHMRTRGPAEPPTDKPTPDMRSAVARLLRYAQRNVGENQR